MQRVWPVFTLSPTWSNSKTVGLFIDQLSKHGNN